MLTHGVSLCWFLPSESNTHVPKCAPSACIRPFSCASFVETAASTTQRRLQLQTVLEDTQGMNVACIYAHTYTYSMQHACTHKQTQTFPSVKNMPSASLHCWTWPRKALPGGSTVPWTKYQLSTVSFYSTACSPHGISSLLLHFPLLHYRFFCHHFFTDFGLHIKHVNIKRHAHTYMHNVLNRRLNRNNQRVTMYVWNMKAIWLQIKYSHLHA